MLVNLLITFCHRSGWNPVDYLIFECQATCSQKQSILLWFKRSCLAMLQTVTTTTTLAFISLMWNVKQNWSPKPQIYDSCSHRRYRKIQRLSQDCHSSYFYFSNLTNFVIIEWGRWEFPWKTESHNDGIFQLLSACWSRTKISWVLVQISNIGFQ